jgi:hypothetical protein
MTLLEICQAKREATRVLRELIKKADEMSEDNRVYITDDNGYEIEVDLDLLDETTGKHIGLYLEGPLQGYEIGLTEAMQAKLMEKTDD